ncbi:MAG: hypothetical protein ACI9VR_000431 [Cognaticolwellia sp.]|jgi:hypothetical protein
MVTSLAMYSLGVEMGEWTKETAEWYAQKYGEYPTNLLGLRGLDFQHGDRVVDLGRCRARRVLKPRPTLLDAS